MPEVRWSGAFAASPPVMRARFTGGELERLARGRGPARHGGARAELTLTLAPLPLQLALCIGSEDRREYEAHGEPEHGSGQESHFGHPFPGRRPLSPGSILHVED